MNSRLEPGERVELLIYFIDNQKVCGYSTAKKKECTAIINASKYNIQYGELLTFTVSKYLGEMTFEPILDQVTNEGKPSYVQTSGKGMKTKIESFMIFPSKFSSLDDHPVCWSTEGYGWIYVPTYYIRTTNIFYSAYIIRDSSTCTCNADCLFTIANPNQIRIVEEGKMNLKSNLEEMREAVRIRLKTTNRSPPKSFLSNYTVLPLTSKELGEKQENKEANWPPYNGGSPLYLDSEDETEEADDEEENPANMKAFHSTQPQHGVVHPKAGYEPMEKKGAYQKNQEVQKFKSNQDDEEEQQQKGGRRDFDNSERQQSTNYFWNQDERRSEDRQRQWVQPPERQNNFSNQPGYNDRRSDMKSDYGWNRDEELSVEQRRRARNDWKEDRDDRRNHSRRSDSPPQRSDYGSQRGEGQNRNYFQGFDVDYDAGKCKMEPCLCIDSSPNGSTFFCPGGEKADLYSGYAILIPNYQIKLGSWVEMLAYKVRSKNRAGANYVGIYDSIKKMMMSVENIFIRDELLYMDVCANLKFKKPIGCDKYSLYSEEIGKIISKHDLDFEKEGQINLTDMQQCPLGQEWRVWIRYNYHIDNDGYGYYQWDALKVRGLNHEVEEYDARMSRVAIEAIFDDVDINKQRKHLLHYQTIDINGQSSSSSHSSYDKLNDLPIDHSKASYYDNSSNATRAEPQVSYDKLLKLHHLFYKNNEIRQRIKTADYDAYVELESICKETQGDEYEGNRQSAANSQNASRFSAPSRQFQQPPTDTTTAADRAIPNHHTNAENNFNGRNNTSNYSWND